MKTQEKQYDVGVLVGRFQVPELHEAHRALIQHVIDNHGKVVVVLGLSPVPSTRNNPLDFEARKQMLLAAFPDINVLFIKDVNDDVLWSKRLDTLIGNVITPKQSVVLYGGRDSFIAHYSGRFDTRELVQESWISGQSIREKIARSATVGSPEFRAGVIWSAYSRHLASYQTIDVAVFNDDYSKVLLGRKEYEKGYRFLGGFVEPKSPSLEDNARREVFEEAGVEIGEAWYICSTVIDDWRYRNEADGIMTAFFGAKYLHGTPTPGDDIAKVRWFDLAELSPEQVMPLHRQLLANAFAAAQLRRTTETQIPIEGSRS